jgi:hypothetical protein
LLQYEVVVVEEEEANGQLEMEATLCRKCLRSQHRKRADTTRGQNHYYFCAL